MVNNPLQRGGVLGCPGIYLRDLQATYIGLIVYLLSAIDFPVPLDCHDHTRICFNFGGERRLVWETKQYGVVTSWSFGILVTKQWLFDARAGPYKWPKINGFAWCYFTLLIGVTTSFITGRGPACNPGEIQDRYKKKKGDFFLHMLILGIRYPFWNFNGVRIVLQNPNKNRTNL